MVRIEDVTKKELVKQKRTEKISSLLKEVFGNKFEVRVVPVGIELKEKETDTILGYIDDTLGRMRLKERGYVSKAVAFGKRYEEEIGLLNSNLEGEFVIETKL